MDCPLKLFFIGNDVLFLFLCFFLNYLFKHFLLPFEQHLPRWEVELNLALFVHMFVDVFFNLVVERAFFEVEVGVHHGSVDVYNVSSVFLFVKDVTSAVEFLLQEGVCKGEFIHFLPFLCVPGQVFGPLVYVKLFDFYPCFLGRLRIRALILFLVVLLLLVLCRAIIDLLFTCHFFFIQFSQSD